LHVDRYSVSSHLYPLPERISWPSWAFLAGPILKSLSSCRRKPHRNIYDNPAIPLESEALHHQAAEILLASNQLLVLVNNYEVMCQYEINFVP
jgi:hypothetical protein